MWLFFFFLMYMCKTRGLSTAILMSLSSLWRKLCASSLARTLNLEEYFILCFFFVFFFSLSKASGRSHSLFVLEAVREREGIMCYAWIRKHARRLFFSFLTHIPKNCASFHCPASQAPSRASLTHSNLCLPRQSYSSVITSVGDLPPQCDSAGSGIHVDP